MNRRDFACSLSAVLANPTLADRIAAQSNADAPMDNLHSSVPSGPPQ